ncbi:metal-dependent hydrolase [Candidatus Falkowbacteria bacterium HGW-Falkowbacteria-1]|jgi:hypothetical protein|uniref:Metal-dependent hydrolase n=1 Tax=Candidatus Falkowbacteria bacterium HGW-Falkowbacteria-1 TaxID=2013768 RepID=A0A2N2E9T9_9BACT|nr:MAG: metal-dependent hydrolase [Candidatus Falkowbacteria bacterium HGW-Falkowbacteria-1]
MIKQTIKIKDKDIEYTLKTSQRARRMRLAIYCDGDFIVTRPRGFSDGMVERFIVQKSNWLVKKLEHFKKFKGRILGDDGSRYVTHKKEAAVFIKNKVEEINKIYKFKYNRISIKNQKTCWGSCSRKNNLNFNYKILFLPEKMADYIVTHELCHLGELNHSRRFWNLVAQTIPDYLEVRKELKSSGLGLY